MALESCVFFWSDDVFFWSIFAELVVLDSRSYLSEDIILSRLFFQYDKDVFGLYFRIRVLKLWSRYIEIIIEIGSLFELKILYFFYSGKKDSKSTFIIKISLQKMTIPSFITLI